MLTSTRKSVKKTIASYMVLTVSTAWYKTIDNRFWQCIMANVNNFTAFGRLQINTDYLLWQVRCSHLFFPLPLPTSPLFVISFLHKIFSFKQIDSHLRVGDTQQTSLFIVVIELNFGWLVTKVRGHAHAHARSLARSLFNDEKWHKTNKYWMGFISISVKC